MTKDITPTKFMAKMCETKSKQFQHSQSGNLSILLPLWFYVKSILADFWWSKTAIWTILEALNFEFYENFTNENVKNSNLRAAKMVKMAVFECFKMTKIDFT